MSYLLQKKHPSVKKCAEEPHAILFLNILRLTGGIVFSFTR